MKVNFLGNRYSQMELPWTEMSAVIFCALEELGYGVRADKSLSFSRDLGVSRDLHKAPDLSIFNHITMDELKYSSKLGPENTLIWKPTGPDNGYFSIDSLGYAAHSSITYEKPDFEGSDDYLFFETTAKKLIEGKRTKWSDIAWHEEHFQDIRVQAVPQDHVLVLGQMGGDETTTKMSFGHHYRKLEAIVEQLLILGEYKIVVKLHPYMKVRTSASDWDYWKRVIEAWTLSGVTVINDFTSLHDILPKTRVAVLENSTAGIECLLHEVPIISYGYPEYHWVTKDLRHLLQVKEFVKDLSWWDSNLSRKWISWYCTDYLCHDKESTIKRLKELL